MRLPASPLDLRALLLALGALVPNAVLYVTTGDLVFVHAGILTIACLIVAERVHGSFAVMGAYAALTAALAVAFYVALANPFLFVGLVCVTGFVSVAAFPGKTRSFGNYLFLVALYLACETHGGAQGMIASSERGPAAPMQGLEDLLLLLACSPLGIVGVAVSLVLQDGAQGWRSLRTLPEKRLFAALSPMVNGPSPKTSATPTAWRPMPADLQEGLVRALAVLLAAAHVEIVGATYGQWAIWSAASVASIDYEAANAKARTRAVGAVVGVALGFAASFALPATAMVYSLSVLAIMLSLVAVRQYGLAFALRSGFVALAAIAAAEGYAAGVFRIENVIVGGMIGFVVARIVGDLMRPRADRRTPEALSGEPAARSAPSKQE